MRPMLAVLCRLASGRRFLVGVLAALATAALAASALAENGSQKITFVDRPTYTCNGAQPGSGTPGKSFVIINRNGTGGVSAEVSLKDAQPDTRYSVELWQSNCSQADFYAVTTNSQGDANRHIGSPPTSNQRFFVLVDPGPRAPVPRGNFKQTPELIVGP